MQVYVSGKQHFPFFHRILCDTSKKSRGKNLIIVALKCNTFLPSDDQDLIEILSWFPR